MDHKTRSRSRNESTSWPQGPLEPSFPTDRIDVWRVRLDESSKISPHAAILSCEELTRGNRFRFETDRLHFIRCRLALRDLLSRYLGIPAEEVTFEYQFSGKPELPAQQNPCQLRFNVSHSGHLALIALSAKHNLGIDVEKTRLDLDIAALAERFFSARERVGLQALPDHLRLSGFFACWTRKEAFLKATGEGLGFPLSEFSVSTHPEATPQLEEIRGDANAAQRWFVADLDTSQGYRASVAIRCVPLPLVRYRWN
jgi:4'-phosphopantetheinyl transferase